ncbi:hypothetical protein [Pedobacter frigoris]|uniref:hypothetical protein n=1 Tax=Pedobacter frigoris TaxID=2571272 RepID=UPI002930FACA|nr:hypothetical protein [Pedobacter frigoris]
MTDQYNMKTDLKIGEHIFENLPNDIRPGWAGLVLSRFDNYLKYIPTPVLDLYPVIDNKSRWPEAHEQFTKIRMWILWYEKRDFI